MERELSYLNPEGFTVFTSYYHKKRGHCCDSVCLHCPFGMTLKKIGLVLKSITIHEKDVILGPMKMEIGHRKIDWERQELYGVTLKGFLCGLYLKEGAQRELILKERFKDQGITLEMVEQKVTALKNSEGQKS